MDRVTVPEMEPVEQIVAAVRRGKKYRSVCEDVVRRIASEQWARRAATTSGSRRALKDATKATRALLHQVYGAYESPVDYDRA